MYHRDHPSTQQWDLCSSASLHWCGFCKAKGLCPPRAYSHFFQSRPCSGNRDPRSPCPSGSWPPGQTYVASFTFPRVGWAASVPAAREWPLARVWVVPACAAKSPYSMCWARGVKGGQMGLVLGVFPVLWHCAMQFWRVWKFKVYT